MDPGTKCETAGHRRRKDSLQRLGGHELGIDLSGVLYRWFYRASWEFVRTLERHHGKDALDRVLSRMKNGTPFNDNLVTEVGGSCSSLYRVGLMNFRCLDIHSSHGRSRKDALQGATQLDRRAALPEVPHHNQVRDGTRSIRSRDPSTWQSGWESPSSHTDELPHRRSTKGAHGRLYFDYLGPCGFDEQIDRLRVTSENQDLVGLGKVREGLCNQSGTLRVEIDQYFVDNHR